MRKQLYKYNRELDKNVYIVAHVEESGDGWNEPQVREIINMTVTDELTNDDLTRMLWDWAEDIILNEE